MKFNKIFKKKNLGTISFGEETYLIISIVEYPNGKQFINLINVVNSEESQMIFDRNGEC
jgi:hypothetical protein